MSIADGPGQRYLAFSLGGEEYAAPLLKVKEVIALTDITPVPHTPPYFRGIMNLRGAVISVIDLRQKFRMPAAVKGPESAIIILDLAPLCLGVVVDAVNYVFAAAPDEVLQRPDIESQVQSDYILGVMRREERLLILLDIAKTLSVDDYAVLHDGQRRSATTNSAKVAA